MKKYNKNAKLLHIIFIALGFVLLVLSMVYMTQYSDLFLYQSQGGFGNNPDDILTNNTSWASFMNNTQNNPVIEEIKILLGFTPGIATGHAMSAAFVESAPVIREYYLSMQDVNWNIFYYALITVVVIAVSFLFSNHSRRIYYKSNLVVGVIAAIAVIGFGVYVFISNTSLIPGMNEKSLLLNCLDYVCNDPNQGIYIGNIATVTERNTINIGTIIAVDFIIAAVIGYASFMLVYTVKRYNECEQERKDIIAKAVSLNE